jgi:chitinase
MDVRIDRFSSIRVSYDDAETRKLKMEYAAQNCLGGTLSWAVDMSSLGDPKDGLGL